jgi:hypothetical protein
MHISKQSPLLYVKLQRTYSETLYLKYKLISEFVFCCFVLWGILTEMPTKAELQEIK